MRGRVRRMVIAGLGALIAGIAALYLFQDRMIYFPRRYSDAELNGLPKSVRKIEFSSVQGKQTAFYIAPTGNGRPLRVWIAFGGNGSVALDWLELAANSRRDPRDAFLLVDYPGYGLCEGCPGPTQIRENGERAFEEVARLTGESPDSLARRTGVIGHSLGCAAGLLFGSSHPVDRVILLAPFTSLLDMAGRRIGWPLKYLLRGNYDNRAALDVLAARNPRPEVTILHGTNDEIIPFDMGRSLAEAHPEMVTFIPVQGATHDGILEESEERVFRLMAEKPDTEDESPPSATAQHSAPR